MLSFSECLVCVCVLFIYTISISILCVSREELSLIKSNQQTCDFYKWAIRKYLISANNSFSVNTDSCCEHITGGVNIYLYGCVSLLAPVCAVCLCMFVWYQIRLLAKKPRYVSDLSKLDALLHKTHLQILLVLKYQGSTCVNP